MNVYKKNKKINKTEEDAKEKRQEMRCMAEKCKDISYKIDPVNTEQD